MYMHIVDAKGHFMFPFSLCIASATIPESLYKYVGVERRVPVVIWQAVQKMICTKYLLY